jgi:hypothetical protein
LPLQSQQHDFDVLFHFITLRRRLMKFYLDSNYHKSEGKMEIC